MQGSLDRIQPWRRYQVFLHIIGWTGYITIIVLLWDFGAVDPNPASLTRFFITVVLILPGLFYANILILIPRFFQGRQWAKWFGGHAGALVLMVLIEVLIAGVLGKEQLTSTLWPALQNGLGWVAAITSIAFIYRYFVDGIAMPMRMERLQADKDAAELAFLKSQIDPHFLFNTLNNLYALALEEEAPQTAESITLLGRLMRYSLHDAQAEVITLEKEVQYLETYVDLQRLRAMPHASIAFHVEISEDDMQSHKIAPMLLIPFVENAFKYGLHASKPTSIQVQLGISNSALSMKCTNTINRTGHDSKPGKIGLENVKQRLQRLYPNAHTLYLDAADQTYTVQLEVLL